MFDRLVLGVVLCVTGYNGLFPDPPQPLTPSQLQAKAKAESRSEVCKKQKKQSKELKELCKRWRQT